jgi:beta-fructofuranosidase
MTIKPATDLHRPRYHFTAPTNWINDPNGVCFHGGRYHLYYQYNPNAAKWGDIHWGHATSTDLAHWQDEPIALAPSPGADAGGCFSGSFAVVNGKPTLYYTGFTTERQVQCAATSDDLQHWTKHPERTIVEPPEGVDPQDFRDPYVFRHEGHWYMVVGASLNHERGQALLYRSDDGVAWEDRGALYTAPDLRLGVMWECPNFFPLGDKWVLVVSQWLGLGVFALIGRFENERFVPEAEQVIDVDAGAFAPLTMHAPDGRTLQWGWMNEQREQVLIDADGWAGAMTVPRQLSLDTRGRLELRPVAEIERLRGTPAVIEHTGAAQGALYRFSGRHLDIEAEFSLRDHDKDKVGLTLLAAPDGSELTRVVFWPDARRLSVVRSHSSLDARVRRQDVHAHLELDPGEPLRLRVLLDASVLEVYANDRLCLATRIYPTQAESVLGSVFVEGRSTATVQAWEMGAMLPAERPPLKPS